MITSMKLQMRYVQYLLLVSALFGFFSFLYKINRVEGQILPDSSTEEAASVYQNKVQASVILHPTQAVVELKELQTASVDDIELTLTGGSNPKKLTLFGGKQTIAAGTNLPNKQSFLITNTLTEGITYYVRLYIKSGTTSLIYPPAASDPIAVVAKGGIELLDYQGDVLEYEGDVLGDGTIVLNNSVTATAPVGTSSSATNTASSGIFSGLVPCGNPGQDMCTFNDVLTLISNVINYIFVLIVPITAIAFIIVGFQYMTSAGKIELRTLLKERIGKLLFGIVIILGAWLLMATLLRGLGVDEAYILLDL